MPDRHHGFLVETDMDTVLITTGSGERFGLTADQAMELVDNLVEAVTDSRDWAPHDPFERDQTYKED